MANTAERVNVTNISNDTSETVSVDEENRAALNEIIDTGADYMTLIDGHREALKEVVAKGEALGVNKKALRRVIQLVHKDQITDNRDEINEMDRILHISGRDFL
jgi:hypothetical protein